MYLGIDVGTSGVKALLINDGGLVVANDTASLDVLRHTPAGQSKIPQIGGRR